MQSIHPSIQSSQSSFQGVCSNRTCSIVPMFHWHRWRKATVSTSILAWRTEPFCMHLWMLRGPLCGGEGKGRVGRGGMGRIWSGGCAVQAWEAASSALHTWSKPSCQAWFACTEQCGLASAAGIGPSCPKAVAESYPRMREQMSHYPREIFSSQKSPMGWSKCHAGTTTLHCNKFRWAEPINIRDGLLTLEINMYTKSIEVA